MSSVNEENARIKERARIREQVVSLEGEKINEELYIKRVDVLKIVSGGQKSIYDV